MDNLFSNPSMLFPALVMGALLIFVIIYFIVKAMKKRRTDRIGKNGEKRVAKMLDRFARKHNGYALHDLYLPLYDKTTQVDHVLLGQFGMLVIETKAANGEVYGTETDREWVHIIGEQRHKLYNPLLQNKAHVDCIAHLLRVEKIYKVRIDSLVVFAGKKIQLNIPKGMPVITSSLLKSYLKKPHYQEDCGIDAKAVYEVLKRHEITDKAIRKQHNQNVKEMSKGNR